MSPEYDKLVDIMKEKRDDVLVARLEGSINEEIAMIYEIFSFPKIVLFNPGSVDIRSNFRGQRIAPIMTTWIDQNAPRLEKKSKYLDNDKKEKQEIKEKELENRQSKVEADKKRNSADKIKSYDLEDAVDSAKNKNITGELEFLKIEMLNMKNRILNAEKDIEEFKNITKIMISKNQLIKSEEYSSNNLCENQDDIANKLKMIKQKKKKGEGFFDKMTTFDLFLYVGIFLFIFGTVITIKKIVFKKGKSLITSEHVKV